MHQINTDSSFGFNTSSRDQLKIARTGKPSTQILKITYLFFLCFQLYSLLLIKTMKLCTIHHGKYFFNH